MFRKHPVYFALEDCLTSSTSMSLHDNFSSSSEGFLRGPQLAEQLLDDSLRIFVQGGSGGNGLPKFGGIGGQGGNVYLVGKESASLKNLITDFPNKRIVGYHGKSSTHNFIIGPPGEDVNVYIPVGVTAYTDEGKKLGELNEDGEKILVAKGGTGGHPKNQFFGRKGDAYSVNLELKLIADIGLVGFPNAGKSTLLKAISHARPKIASYPFTTIKPNVGIIMYKDFRQISMADLPGLIEGAHKNKGMGHRFLRHIERTKLLLLVVDINGFQLSPQYPHRTCLDTIILLNKELEMYNKEMLDKPTLLIINKIDTDGATEKFNEIQHKVQFISEYFTNYPEDMRPEKALVFEDVITISAKDGENVESIKSKLRRLLDVQAEINEQQENNNAKVMNNLREILQERGPQLA